MTDSIHTGDIKNSKGVAIGPGATATVIHYTDTPPKFPLDNLPPPNPNFAGRQSQLDAVNSAFSIPHSTIAITQAIAGLGGVGKTQLALAYAHARRDAYDLIWLLRADEAAALDGDLRRLGETLHLPVQTADAPTARQMTLSWLNGTEKRWLLLYDNVDAMAARELRPYLPGGRGHVLITSRRPHWPGARKLTLDVFTADEAADFWRRRLVQSGRLNQSFADLAEELGYLPLALAQAAAYMETREKTPADYLRLYRQRRAELWRRQPPPDDYEKTVTTTWEMAFAYARQTPGAAELLNLCCFLAPDDIPLDVIKENASIFKRSIWKKILDLFKRLPGTDELTRILHHEMILDDALAALTAYSLLAQADGKLSLHRLVGAVARERMGAERAQVWAEAAVALLCKAYRFDQHDMSTWPACGQLLPHVMAAVTHAADREVNSNEAAFLNNEAGFYLRHYGDLAGARPYRERALAILEAKLGPDHPNTKIVRGNLQSLS